MIALFGFVLAAAVACDPVYTPGPAYVVHRRPPGVFTICWDPPVFDPNSYVLQQSVEPTFTNAKDTSIFERSGCFDVETFSSTETTYYFRAAMINACGERSAYSEPVAVTVPRRCYIKTATLNFPTTVPRLSSGNTATLTTPRPLVFSEWRINTGFYSWVHPRQDTGWISSISSDLRTITYSVGLEKLVFDVYAVDDEGCTVTASYVLVDVTDPLPQCGPVELPDKVTFSLTGGTRTVPVKTACEWIVKPVPPWLTIAGGSGSGDGAFTISAAPNTNSEGRYWDVAVNGSSIRAYQQGKDSTGPHFDDNLKTDLLWRNSSTGMLFAQWTDGLNTVGGQPWNYYTDPVWRPMATPDIDRDGISDIIWMNWDTRVMAGQLYDMSKIKFVRTSDSVWTPHTPLALARFARNGRPGLGIQNSSGYYSSVEFVWFFPPHSIHQHGLPFGWIETDPSWVAEALADFDGDLLTNILWRHSESGACFISHLPGPFHFEPDRSWVIAAAGDVNGDGMADLVWRNSADGRVWIQLLNGSTVLGSGVVWVEPDPHWVIKGMGDYNGDGKMDLLWRNDQTGVVFGMLLDGLVVTASGVMHHEPDLQWKLVDPSSPRVRMTGNNLP